MQKPKIPTTQKMKPNYKHILDICYDDRKWQEKKMEKTVKENEPELDLRLRENILALDEIIKFVNKKMKEC